MTACPQHDPGASMRDDGNCTCPVSRESYIAAEDQFLAAMDRAQGYWERSEAELNRVAAILETARDHVRSGGSPCPTCEGASRETNGMVCRFCGTDYATTEPWREIRAERDALKATLNILTITKPRECVSCGLKTNALTEYVPANGTTVLLCIVCLGYADDPAADLDAEEALDAQTPRHWLVV